MTIHEYDTYTVRPKGQDFPAVTVEAFTSRGACLKGHNILIKRKGLDNSIAWFELEAIIQTDGGQGNGKTEL